MKERESVPSSFDDPYSDMTMDEKSKLIMELAGNNSKLLANNQSLLANNQRLMEKLDKLTLLVESIKSRLDESERLNIEKDALIHSLQKQLSDLQVH